MGVAEGGIPTRGPIVQEGFLEIDHILRKYLLVNLLTLRNHVQALYLIEIRGRGLPRTNHLDNLRKKNLILLMVR